MAQLWPDRRTPPTASATGLALGFGTQAAGTVPRTGVQLHGDECPTRLRGHTSGCEFAAMVLIAEQLKLQLPVTSPTSAACMRVVPGLGGPSTAIHVTTFVHYYEEKAEW